MGIFVKSVTAAVVIGLATTFTAAAAVSFPDQWLNGGPLDGEALQGKLVLLYFFEEGCPRCAGRWPTILRDARSLDGKPAVVIAVNSGTPAAEVQGYVRQMSIDIPVIVDEDRSFESKMGVNTISLNNIYQLVAVQPDGRVVRLGTGDIAPAADKLLAGAKWRVDPANVPEKLKRAWRDVEFGDYRSAIAQLRRAGGGDTKEAADQLMGAIDADLERREKAAQALVDGGKAWEAYKAYDAMSTSFAGHKRLAEATRPGRKLAIDPAVKLELKAREIHKKIGVMLASPDPRQEAAGKQALSVLIDKYPETEAAALARRMGK